MRSVPIELQEEMLADVVAAQHLITVTTATNIYRWTDGQNAIYYNGKWWIPKGIIFDTLGSTVTSQLDSLTLEIDNADMAFSDLVLTEDIRGSLCVIEVVYLDNNLAIIGVPVILFQGFIDRMPIDRAKARVEVFSHMIRWKLMTPRRQHTPSCPWVFKGTECGYIGEVYRNPISHILAEFTRSHLASNYFNVDDRLNDLCIGAIFTADSDYGGYVVANAFDRNAATFWQSANTACPHWMKVQFAVAKIITSYKITQNTAANSPVDFIFQGSNDNATWIDLDNRNGVTWGNETFKTFEFDNITAYLYYRLYINKNTALANYTLIKEFELFGPSTQFNDSDYNYTSLVGGSSQYPPAYSDTYVKATTKYSIEFWPFLATDPSKPLTGTNNSTSWSSISGSQVNQRFHIDLGSAKIVRRIYYHNAHSSGTITDTGVKNFTLWGSNTAADFADLVYANNGTWVQLTTSPTAFDQHVASDAADPKYISVTNTTAYRYYAFKFADNWGHAQWMGVRRIELQTALDPAASDMFGVAIISLSAVTGIVVTVRVRAKQTTASARNLMGRIKYNGTYYSASAITPATSFTDYDFVWLLNPATSAAWTVANMALLQGAGYGISYDFDAHEVDVSECYIKVTNTITGLSCDLSPERCLALNNRDQFGGFVYIPELQTKEYYWGSKPKIWGGGL